MDTGINPYHVAFRAPSWSAHPSTFIPGYPEDAIPLYLTLGSDDYWEAYQADRPLWQSVKANTVYYVPGTRIVGLFTPDEDLSPLDHDGHGTAVADAGAGSYGGVNPQAAIVAAVDFAVEGTMDFIHANKWIDVVSQSAGCFVSRPGDVHWTFPILGTFHWQSQATTTYMLAEEGRLSFNGAGNGLTGTNMWCESDPPWSVLVGGAIVSQYGPPTPCLHCDRPYEVVANSHGYLADVHTIEGRQDVGGTSIASPRAAAYGSLLIQDARVVLRDFRGLRDGAYASGTGVGLPAAGPLADGRITSTDIEHLLRQTAIAVPLWQSWSPFSDGVDVPEELRYLTQGYGLVNETSYEAARRVLLGEETPQDRPWDDYWHARSDAVSGAFWYTSVCRGLGPPEDWPACLENLQRAYSPPLLPPL